jgi:hypothetical protein
VTTELTPRLILARAAAIGLLVAVPAALVNVALADQDPKPVGALNATLLAMAAGFVVAGAVAGMHAATDAAKQGTLAAVVVFALVQAVGLLGRLDRGDPIRPVGIVLFGLFAACLGALGGLWGAGRRARKERS